MRSSVGLGLSRVENPSGRLFLSARSPQRSASEEETDSEKPSKQHKRYHERSSTKGALRKGRELSGKTRTADALKRFFRKTPRADLAIVPVCSQ